MSKSDGPALNMNHWHRYGLVGITTLVCIVAFAAIGYMLDILAGTGKHWIMVLFILISFPITQIVLAKKMRQYAKNHFKNYKANAKKK